MDYKTLVRHANEKYKHFIVDIIGQTKCKRNIYKWSCVFDSTRPFVLIQASIHAREFITTDIAYKFIRQIENDYANLKDLGTPNIIILPMVNPDGVELVKYGLKSVPKRLHNQILKINNSSDFKMFKANINGVDLNNNFNALWERQKGSDKPSPSGFKGECFESEIETKTLARETKFYNVSFSISLHAKGEEIYYRFYQKKQNNSRDKKIAKCVQDCIGYKIKNVERKSSGGYKDWCIQKLGIPALTIEVGDDTINHPIEEKYAENIFYKLKGLCYTLYEIINIVGDYDGRKVHEGSLSTCDKS